MLFTGLISHISWKLEEVLSHHNTISHISITDLFVKVLLS